MVDASRVARLLRGVLERVAQLEAMSRAVRAADEVWLAAAKHFFITAIEGCIDVGQHLAASERWAAPDTNAAVFPILARHGVVEPALAARLARAVGVRNVLVHQHVDVDDARVVAAFGDLGDLTDFVRPVGTWMDR